MVRFVEGLGRLRDNYPELRSKEDESEPFSVGDHRICFSQQGPWWIGIWNFKEGYPKRTMSIGVGGRAPKLTIWRDEQEVGRQEISYLLDEDGLFKTVDSRVNGNGLQSSYDAMEILGLMKYVVESAQNPAVAEQLDQSGGLILPGLLELSKVELRA